MWELRAINISQNLDMSAHFFKVRSYTGGEGPATFRAALEFGGQGAGASSGGLARGWSWVGFSAEAAESRLRGHSRAQVRRGGGCAVGEGVTDVEDPYSFFV